MGNKSNKSITQAELFGVDELERVTKDPKTGVGTLPTRVPELGVVPVNVPYRSLAPETRARVDAFMKALAETTEAVAVNHEDGSPVGCSPLPWHWEEGGGGAINVLDANNNMVFCNVNGGEIYSDRDWENVELVVACVNRFAESLSAEHLDRLRKRQVYGSETAEEQ